MSDINEKVTLTVTVEGAVAQVSRTDKPPLMLDGEYDMATMFGACQLFAYFANTLASKTATPEQMIESMAGYAKTML